MTKTFDFLAVILLTFFLSVITVNFSYAQSHQYAAPTGGQTIQSIEVEGVQRIEPATVISYIDVRTGEPLTQDAMDRAVQSLFATGLFADIKVNQRGNVLVVSVIENPVINEIAFEGNDKLKTEQLMGEIQLRPRQVFTRTKVQTDVNRLFQLYQRNGRFSVGIEPKIIELDQNRVNLVFEVDEGDVTKVSSIRFVGNKKYDDDKLRDVISTKKHRWYNFLSSSDRYDPDRLGYDQELLRRYYLSQGYADFRIVSANAELSPSRDSFFLTITVEEGSRYRVGQISIDSELPHFDAAVLKSQITFKKGEWYNAEEVKKSVDNITNDLGDRQYAFVNVRTEVRRDRDAKTVDITFVISEAPRVFVERINVNGNVRTLDKVLRREMLLEEGDPFNRTKLARSEQNLKDLGYFENVEISPRQGSAPDKTDIDITVTEKSTGELNIGAGFSTADGPLADFRITERNLLGKGQILSFGATVAGERTEFSASFTEPFFLDRDFSAGIDVFHTTLDLQDESSYDQRRTGGGLRFAYPLSDKWRQSLRYRIERNDITDVASDASLYVKLQAGQRITSAIGQGITYDSRDSTMNPTNGLLGWFDTEYAGVGGDAHYVSGKLGASYFYPIADKWVFNLLGETGAIEAIGDDSIRINERYFLGGQNLRGFESAGVGPRDLVTKDALGGNYYYRATAEITMPTPIPEQYGFKGHIFSDMGSLWEFHDKAASSAYRADNTLRASAGVGLSWRSPMGPIRGDFAKAFLKEDYDETEVFRFSFGTKF
jgi:outer membrane protein insertion porin family